MLFAGQSTCNKHDQQEQKYGEGANVLETFLDNCALTPRRRTTHHPSLMVKVAEDDKDSSPFWAQGVLNRYLDVLKCDVGSTSS